MVSTTKSPPVKRPPGRPRVFDTKWEAEIRNLFPELTTQRSVTDRMYALAVLHILGRHDRFDWLTAIQSGGRPRWVILAALGRCHKDGVLDEEEVIDWAEIFCEQRPRTADAVCELKKMRVGASVYDGLALSESISQTILDYYSKCDRDADVERTKVLLENVFYFVTGEEWEGDQ